MCCPHSPGCQAVLRVTLQGLALLAELSCPAHALSENTLRAQKALSSLAITLLDPTMVASSVGNHSKELWSNAASLATLARLLPEFSHDLAPNSGSLEKEFIFSSWIPHQGLI